MADNSEQFSFETCLNDSQRAWRIFQALGGGVAFAGLTNTQLRASAVPVSLPTGNTTEAGLTLVANGTIAAGTYRNITFLAGTGTTVTVLGMPLAVGASLTRTAPDGMKLGAIAYTVSGGNLYAATGA